MSPLPPSANPFSDGEERDPLDWIDGALQELERQDLRRRMRVRQSPHVAGQVHLDQTTLVDFSSNDYLSLSADSRLVDAANRVAAQVGWGSAASPLVTGYGVWHQRLERELAAWKGTEAAVLCTTGYATNLATIPALVGNGDVVFSDAWNHASIIDGCRLSGATIAVYRHADGEDLSRQMARHPAARRRLIVTDSLFSMDGDLAPLPDLVALARDSGAMLMIDEAHASGVFGESGGGVAEFQGMSKEIDIQVGTLSKALGSFGGFVAGRQSLIDWIRNRGRAYLFSTAQPEAISAASLAALMIVREEPFRRIELLKRAADLRARFRERGFSIEPSESQIIPIILGSAKQAMDASAFLLTRGLLVPAIRPPAVPEGSARLRICLGFQHTDEHCQQLLQALDELPGGGVARDAR